MSCQELIIYPLQHEYGQQRNPHHPSLGQDFGADFGREVRRFCFKRRDMFVWTWSLKISVFSGYLVGIWKFSFEVLGYIYIYNMFAIGNVMERSASMYTDIIYSEIQKKLPPLGGSKSMEMVWVLWWLSRAVFGLVIYWVSMGVSENSGTPKSSILIRFCIINHLFWGTPIFDNTLYSI